MAEVDRVRPEPYAPPEVLLLTDEVVRQGDGAAVRYLARDDVCATLEVEGRCPERPGEVLVNRDDLRGLAVGDPVEAPLLGQLEIVGVYSTPATTADWLYPSVLASRPATPAPNVQPYRPAPYVVVPDVVAGLRPGLWDVQLESRLVVPDRLDDEDFDALVTEVAQVRDATTPIDGGQLVGTSTVNALASVLEDVRGQREAARAALAPAVVSLVLVALAMILRLQVATVGLRAPEQALAALRGVGRRRSWVLGLSEPWLLVLVSVPLGLVAGYAAAAGLARAWLRPGLVLDVPTASVVGAAVVTVAMAGVSAVGRRAGDAGDDRRPAGRGAPPRRQLAVGGHGGARRGAARAGAARSRGSVPIPTDWRPPTCSFPWRWPSPPGSSPPGWSPRSRRGGPGAAPSGRCPSSSPPGPWRAGHRGRSSSCRSRRPSPSPCSPSGSTASRPAGGPASPRPWPRPTTSTTRR